ncbi:hypothetical protein FA95DRAFT_1494462, partial [Auriscalpium vulgare]
LDRIPCANNGVKSSPPCLKDGTKACSSCTLVLYCSKECQLGHWKVHKKDCKDEVASTAWKPQWVRQSRKPTFLEGGDDSSVPLLMARYRWGNVPAYDVLNLPLNECDEVGDLALAFVASGDLRNIVRTLNELPTDHSGKITILVNDGEPYVLLRNILLLLILGKVPDKQKAADVALHFWYSALLPSDYGKFLRNLCEELLLSTVANGGSVALPLSATSSLRGYLSRECLGLLARMMRSQYTAKDVLKEVKRVRFPPGRVDRRDRYIWLLEPSHRLSSLRFRRSGVLLPFGASSFDFNYPNRFLFSPEGQWLMGDTANPLDSWNLSAVVDEGKARGATRADLYGCLHFHVSRQLREFATRLSRFRVDVKVFVADARNLAQDLRAGKLAKHGLPASITFDRIDVSNILDREYVGLEQVCRDWSRMLKNTPHATLLGYFMNWITHAEDGPSNAELMRTFVPRLIAEGRKIMCYTPFFKALHDNSSGSRAYLVGQGLASVLRSERLQLQSMHTIVPPRFGARISDSVSALPVFQTNDDWYLGVRCAG